MEDEINHVIGATITNVATIAIITDTGAPPYLVFIVQTYNTLILYLFAFIVKKISHYNAVQAQYQVLFLLDQFESLFDKKNSTISAFLHN